MAVDVEEEEVVAVEAAAEAVAGTWAVAVVAAVEEAGADPSAPRGVSLSSRATRPPSTKQVVNKWGYTVEVLRSRLGVTIACGACIKRIVGVDTLSIIKTNCHL